MLKLFKYLKKGEWVLLPVILGLIIVQVWLELTIPEYTANLITMVQNRQTFMSEVWKNGGLMLLCAGGSVIASVFCNVLISKVASSFSRNLREKLFQKVSDFSIAEVKDFSTASLITRTTNDVMQMQNFMAMGVQLLFKAPIMAIWAITKISTTNIGWTLSMIISIVIIVVNILVLVFICLPRFKKIQKLTDNLNNVTRENITGVRVIRAFNAEDYQENKFEKVNEDIKRNNLFTARAMGLMSPIMTLVMNGLSLATYWIGVLLVNKIVFTGDFDAMVAERALLVGQMGAFTAYASQVITSFMLLIMIFILLPRVSVSAKRINEVLDAKLSIKDNPKVFKEEKSGEIEFKNVSFSYDDSANKEFALKDISFKASKGETVAIIGATGSSKTTLINLIPRFYDATIGEVLVDGINVKDYSQEDLRNKISIATQTAVLFKGNIKENITFGSEEIDERKVQKVVEISQSNFINELEKGVESEVAQGGTNFSGGQKQRISIARALYKDAEIIIFDDSFSALDYKTDMLVRKAIKENLKDKTVIIVAQRIGTIKDADKILVLDEGQIVGEGSHGFLLENCEIYKEIALSQLSKEEL